MTIEVRAMREEDWNGFVEVREDAYHQPASAMNDNRHLFDLSEMRCLFEDGVMKATGRIYSFRQHLHGRWLEMGGVASIATRLEERGRGHIRRIIREMFVELRAKGVPLTTLYPSVYAVYRRFGYEIVSEKRTITAANAPQLMIASGQKGTIRRGSVEADYELIRDLYERKAVQSQGYLERSEFMWKDRILRVPYLDEPRRVYIWSDDQGTPQAYLLLNPNEGGTMLVKELVAHTADGVTALLGLLTQDNMLKEWTLETELEFPMSMFLHNPRVKTAVTPSFMARIVDVQLAWQTVAPEARSGRAVLGVEDAMCEWNAGAWELTVEDGRGRVQAANGSEAVQASGDITVWTQLFYGYLTLDQAIFSGKLSIHDETIVPFLRKLWASEPKPMMIDAF